MVVANAFTGEEADDGAGARPAGKQKRYIQWLLDDLRDIPDDGSYLY